MIQSQLTFEQCWSVSFGITPIEIRPTQAAPKKMALARMSLPAPLVQRIVAVGNPFHRIDNTPKAVAFADDACMQTFAVLFQVMRDGVLPGPDSI